jgi:hypothetical protein
LPYYQSLALVFLPVSFFFRRTALDIMTELGIKTKSSSTESKNHRQKAFYAQDILLLVY